MFWTWVSFTPFTQEHIWTLVGMENMLLPHSPHSNWSLLKCLYSTESHLGLTLWNFILQLTQNPLSYFLTRLILSLSTRPFKNMKATKNGLILKHVIFILDLYPKEIIINFLLNVVLELAFYGNKNEHPGSHNHHNSVLSFLKTLSSLAWLVIRIF